MHFAPLICGCYVFLYICLPFNTSFWEVPKHTLFASQKKREVRLSWVWYTILFFLFQSCCLLNTILSFQKFASIIESFIHQFLVSSFASWVSFLIFCPLSGGLSTLLSFCPPYSEIWVSFHCFGGGTCLRIFHRVHRFCDDMDFYKITQYIYNRKLKMFVEFHNKSMNCCRLLFFCRVAMQKKALKS